MALVFNLDKFDSNTKIKIKKELILNNGKEYMKFYKIIDNLIYLPYYYGKMLLNYNNIPFDDALKFKLTKKNEYLLVNLRSCHKKIDLIQKYELREHQVEILNEANAQLSETGTIFIKAATGFGKSLGIVDQTLRLGYLVLLLATRKTFINQLVSAFSIYTNAKIWNLCKTDKIPKIFDIIITTPGRFKHIPQEILDKVGTFAIDEAPLVCTYQCINPILSLRPRYIIACSATIGRRDGMHKMLDMIIGPTKVIKKLDLPIRVLQVHSNIKVPFFKGAKGADWNEHCKYICSNIDRNKMIVEIAKKILLAPNKEDTSKLSKTIREISNRPLHKIAMITNRVEDHVKILLPMLSEQKINCDYLDAKKQTYNDCDIVLGTSNKLGIGFDAALTATNYNGEPIDVVFQLVSSATKEIIIQELGRGCRIDLYPVIFIIIIDSNKISKNHANTMREAFSEFDDIEFYNYYGEKDI